MTTAPPLGAAQADRADAAPAARLADAIAARTDTLTARALGAMYANPFWEERYGARGRRFAEEDGRHHVGYLVEALRAGCPDTLTGYARWLQRVLVTRGMCSWHLAEHFARLADAIRAEALPDAGPALDYLHAAEDALLYEAGDDGRAAARAIQEGVVRPLAAAVDPVAPTPTDPAYYASYLADAVAFGRADLLVDYVRWMAGHVERQGGGPAQLAEGIAAVAARVERLAPHPRDVARLALDAARAAAVDVAATTPQ